MSFDWSNHVCLVTGGTGFGGSHLCEQLLLRGAKVYAFDRVLDRRSFFNASGVISKAEVIYGDICDSGMLATTLERLGVHTVFHLAAQPIVPTSNTLPWETLRVNVVGTYAVLEAIRTASCGKRLIFASSGAYYGTTTTEQPIPESHPPLIAANIYSPSKVAADIAVRCYAQTYGLDTVALRFINTYGPGDLNFSRMVPRAIRSLIEQQPFDFGDRDDGTTRLDYMHVRDMANAYIAAAENLDAIRGEAINIGTGMTTSTRDIARLISRLFDRGEREPLFHGAPRRPPVIKCLDVSKAREVIGWGSETDLERGLAETIVWYRNWWQSL